MSLCEDYRPRRWDDVAGQVTAVKAIQEVLARGWGGRAWWLTGASGTGKTTLAKIIASEGASDIATDELLAGGITPADLRTIERSQACRPLPVDGKTGWACIVNEAHKLRKDTVTAFLDVLERIPQHVCWIFTTTKQGQAKLFEDDVAGDALPLVSRCTAIELEDTSASREALAKRALWVAQQIKRDGQGLDAYVQAIHAQKGNLRAVLQMVESGQIKPYKRP